MLRIFEVDQPASQREKRERLESAAIRIPANLTYVVVDFETDSLLSALQRAGFDPLQPVFLSWLGVMAYLRRDTIETIFRSVASLPKSSEIVFTFASESPERKANASSSATETRAESLGEPWLSRFEPVDIDRMLRGMGFSDVSFLTPDEIDQRYIRGRQDGLFVMRRINIASARV